MTLPPVRKRSCSSANRASRSPPRFLRSQFQGGGDRDRLRGQDRGPVCHTLTSSPRRILLVAVASAASEVVGSSPSRSLCSKRRPNSSLLAIEEASPPSPFRPYARRPTPCGASVATPSWSRARPRPPLSWARALAPVTVSVRFPGPASLSQPTLVALGGQMGTHGRKPGRSPPTSQPASDRLWRVAVRVLAHRRPRSPTWLGRGRGGGTDGWGGLPFRAAGCFASGAQFACTEIVSVP